MSKLAELSDSEILTITSVTGIDSDVVKSWHKEFILECPSGKMKKKHFFKFYKMLRGNKHNSFYFILIRTKSLKKAQHTMII